MGQDVDPRTDIFAVGIILWELLAGQRLFLGETDFQTVKKVQQAVVPPISSINRAVTPDLERIIAKALARDPAQRYVTARDLARDLTNFLFKQATPVSAFDVAQLVIGAMKDRAKKKPIQGSIIDKLIEEALLEFTSLGENGQNGAASGGSNADASQATAPLNLGEFVDPKGWLDEMGLDIAKPHPTGDALVPANITAGNLSALEEDDLAGKKIPLPANLSPQSSPQAMARPPTPPGPISAPGPVSAAAQLRAPQKRGSSAMIGILVLVLAVAGIGLAYAMHVFPHH